MYFRTFSCGVRAWVLPPSEAWPASPPHVLVLLHEAEPSSLRRKAEKSAAQALAGKRKKGPKYSLKARIVDGVSLCVSECMHLCLCMHACVHVFA